MSVGSIVVGTDGSPSATVAVERAAELARASGSMLHIVAAYGDDARLIRDAWLVLAAAEETVRPCTVPLRLHAIGDRPFGALRTIARLVDADIIVVGDTDARGRCAPRRPGPHQT